MIEFLLGTPADRKLDQEPLAFEHELFQCRTILSREREAERITTLGIRSLRRPNAGCHCGRATGALAIELRGSLP